MKFLSDIEVEEGLRDKDGGLGADGQVLSSTGSLTSWIDAASGSIGGSIADNQIAVGASTANNIEGSDNFRLVPLTLGSVSAGRLALQGRIVMSDKLAEGAANIFIGSGAGSTAWDGINIGIGGNALAVSAGGELNCALGYSALRNSTLGDENTALGHNSLYYLAGSGQDYNTAIGSGAARYYSTGTDFLTQSSQGVYIGSDTRASANSISNEIAIGYGAVGGGSDTITLGNSSVDLLRIPGLNATSGQVLTYDTTAGGFKAAASGGGGGGISGATVATQVAFGATSSTTEIISDSALFYSNLNGLTIGDAAINGSNAILNLNKGEGGTGRIVMKKLGVSKFDLKLDGSEDAYITAVNTLTITTTQPSGVTKDIILNPTGNVGVGDTSPSSKLSVAGGIQMANDGETSNTNSDKAGTLRYREVTNIGTPKASNSYIDMYMRTEDSTYEWVNIVTNNW